MALVMGLTLEFAVTQMGKAIPGAAGGWLFKSGLDALFPNADTELIRKDIKALSDQVKVVQESIDDLGRQLSNVLLVLRKDHLNSYSNTIIARYDAINFALAEVFNMPEYWQEEQKKLKLEDVKSQTVNVLRACVNEVPVALEEMHSLLNAEDSSSILQLAKVQALESSTDFLSYYAKMQAFIVPFWLAEAKALSLLQMAVDAPSIQYAGGDAAIAKYKDYTQQQEATFHRVLGIPVYNLVKATLKLSDSVTTIPIDLTTDNNKWIAPISLPGVTPVGQANEYHPWVLKPTFPINSIIPSGSYSFELITTQPIQPTWSPLTASWAQYGVSMGYNDHHPSWYVKPTGVDERFVFVFSTTAIPEDVKSQFQQYSGKYLTRLETVGYLGSADARDTANTMQNFNVHVT